MKISEANYYDTNPTGGNACGDIWADLPTTGLLTNSPVGGIVITPACDLAQGKVSTVTYLPVISVREYFSIPDAFNLILAKTIGQLKELQLNSLLEPKVEFAQLNVNTLEAALDLLADKRKKLKKGKENIVIDRAVSGIKILILIKKSTICDVPSQDLICLFGDKEWKDITRKVITNAWRSVIHFLPADRQRREWSGILQHSLALFRYPISAPIDFFNAAQDLTLLDWQHWCEQIVDCLPTAIYFKKQRPMKKLTLKPDFLPDLIGRFNTLFARVGSPDFTSETVDQFSKEL